MNIYAALKEEFES